MTLIERLATALGWRARAGGGPANDARASRSPRQIDRQEDPMAFYLRDGWNRG